MRKVSLKLFKKSLISFAVGSTLLMLGGCGGGGANSSNISSSSPKEQKKIIGYLVDSAVIGVNYRCGKIDSFTASKGQFECETLPVSFYIGDIELGSVSKLPADKKVYPQDLLGLDREETANINVKKISILLQSFDEDQNPNNDIVISEKLNEKLKDIYLNLFDSSLEEIQEFIKEIIPNIDFVSAEDAIEHLQETLNSEANPKTNVENDLIQKAKAPKYTYIPKGDKLTDAMAIRFLSKAGFGANQKDIEKLRSMGVEAWVEEQLNMPLEEDQYLIKTIKLAKEAVPDQNPNTVEEYLADNDIVFNKQYASFFSRRFMESAWFDIAVTSKDQLRQKVAYALSQIIVESDFEPIFIRRGEALSRYFDILAKNALGNYKQLLTDISFNSGMSLFLTFNGSKKLHENEAGVKVYPDENYAREIMQLFSIGLNELNMDGTPKKDSKGNLIPTYTQEDVNELSRVFTGWDLQRNGSYGSVGFTTGDLTHPVEFTADYHDFGEKKLLGQTIPAGLSGEEDVKKAIDIIMSNQNVAPYISKNLIMRLTKSNPSPSYVQRVATIFANTNGDLKKVVKAILLDKEIWDDIKNLRSVKFKEPLIAYISSLKAMNVKPLPYWYFCKFGGPEDDNASNCTRVKNKFLFNDPRSYLGQGAGLAPTVFNFYDNSFVPNSAEFKGTPPTYAPEVQIQDDTILIKFSNAVRLAISKDIRYQLSGVYKTGIYELTETGYGRYRDIVTLLDHAPADGNIPMYYIGADKFLVDLKDDYDFLELKIDGDTDGDFKQLKDDDDLNDEEKARINQAVKDLISYIDNKLTGGLLTQAEKDVIYNAIVVEDSRWIYNKYAGDQTMYAKHHQIMSKVIKSIYRAIITSDKFMTE